MGFLQRIKRCFSGPRLIKKVYVASAAEDWPHARRVQVMLNHCGFEITHDWTEKIRQGMDDVAAQQSPEVWRELAMADMAGVLAADALVFVAPGARGAHTELGAALALGLPVVVYAWRPGLLTDRLGRDCVFYHHPQVRHAENLTDVVLRLGR